MSQKNNWMHPTTSAPEKTKGKLMESRLLKSKEASRYLCISEKTLWNLQKAGEVRAVKLGRLIRYDPADLDAFIEQSKTKIA